MNSEESVGFNLKFLRKFLSFTPTERTLLVQAALLLATIRLGLKWLSFQRLQGILAHMAKPKSDRGSTKNRSVYKVVWAVTQVSPYIPGVRCLARAMAAQVLLERQGYPTQLRIGVGRDREGQLIAHAWLESQGRVVMGGLRNISRYFTPLTMPEGKPYEPQRWYSFSE